MYINLQINLNLLFLVHLYSNSYYLVTILLYLYIRLNIIKYFFKIEYIILKTNFIKDRLNQFSFLPLINSCTP